MKTIFTLITILSFLFLNAQNQYDKGTLYLKDSTELEGLIKVKIKINFSNVKKPIFILKFKINKDSKPSSYNSNLVNGFDIKDEKFRFIKHKNNFAPELLIEEIKGKISLYRSKPQIISSFQTIGTGNTQTMIPNLFYMKVDNKIITIGTHISKKHLVFFKDCPELINKIKNKEFKRKEIFKIINFYNNCN